MKSLHETILEKLKLKNVRKQVYNYRPKNKKELEDIVHELLFERRTGLPNKADLNDIDTSEITDMSDLFKDYDEFDGDISGWNMSNVKSIDGMFVNCVNFTGKGLEKWDVSNITNMQWAFYKCRSLKCDLSNWKVNKRCNLVNTFSDCDYMPDWWDDDWDQL